MQDTAGPATRRTVWEHWDAMPLYGRIAGGLACGLLLGVVLRQLIAASHDGETLHRAAQGLVKLLGSLAPLILRLLGALAPPLILVAVIRALLTTHIPKRVVGRIAYLLVLNTVVAILIGL